MKCPRCNCEFEYNFSKCPECGYEIQNNAAFAAQKPKKTSKVIIAAACAAVVICAGTIVWAMEKNHENVSTDESNETVSISDSVYLNENDSKTNYTEDFDLKSEKLFDSSKEHGISENNSDSIVITTSDGEYDLGTYSQITTLPFDKIVDFCKTYDEVRISDSETYKTKDISDISDGDSISIYAFDNDNNAQQSLRDLVSDCGLNILKNNYAFSDQGSTITVTYSSDNNNPFVAHISSPLFYYESLSLSNHSDDMTFEYDAEVISLTNEELEASLAYDLESSKFENSLYGENYRGKAYDIQEFVGEYTNKNGTTFLIAKDSRDYKNNNETKSYVTGYKAYSVSDGLLHTIMVTNTLSLLDKANDLPNEIDMVSIDEFKGILDSFSTN